MVPWKTILFIIALIFLFVVPSHEFLTASMSFFLYYTIWLLVVAMASWVEGAYTSLQSVTNAPKINQLVNEEKAKHVRQIAGFNENIKKLESQISKSVAGQNTPPDEVQKLERQRRKLVRDRKAAQKKLSKERNRRDAKVERHTSFTNSHWNEIYCRSLGSLQILISAGFASVLPLFMKPASSVTGINISLSSLSSKILPNLGFLQAIPDFEIKSQFMFILLISALPLLFFGTLLPMYLGKGMGYKVAANGYPIARLSKMCFGGLVAPLKILEQRLD